MTAAGTNDPPWQVRGQAMARLQPLVQQWRADRTSVDRSALDEAIRAARDAGCTYDEFQARTGLSSRTNKSAAKP